MVFPDKRAVRRSFSAAAADYDRHAFLQHEVAQRLIERLDAIKLDPARVLDLGSGTGLATERLAARFPKAVIVALDCARPMLEHARAKQAPSWVARLLGRPPAICFLQADAEQLPLANASCDAVFSNLTMQWCDPQRVMAEGLRVLVPRGLFMFATLGPDTLKELRAAFARADGANAQQHVNRFVDMHDLGDMLVEAGFADPVMDQETLTLTYTELKSLFEDLKGIGAHNVMPGRAPGLTGKARWARMTSAYESLRRDGRLPATYEVVYGHAWKPAFARQRAVDGAQAIGLEEFRRMVESGRRGG
jgi:malonyl-CoA O-methyltransferase